MKSGRGMPFTGSGAHFTPGFWRPDKSSGKIAMPEGPSDDFVPSAQRTSPTVSESDLRRRDERTAANMARVQDALAPRRFRPTSGDA